MPHTFPFAGIPKTESHEDYFPYRDLGCDLAPSCLSCPFEQCRYDGPAAQRHQNNTARAEETARILALRDAGHKVIEICAVVGRSERTVQRTLAGTR